MAVTAFEHAVGEGLEFLIKDFFLLFTHGATQKVGLSQGVTGQHLSDGHDLLLVNDDAIGLIQNRGQYFSQLGMDRSDRLAFVFTIGVVVVSIRAHRTGSVQSQYRRNVFEVVRQHRAQESAHLSTIELEDAQGLTLG